MYRRRNARKMPIRMGAYLTRMAPEKAGRQQMGAFGCQLEKVRMEGRIGMYNTQEGVMLMYTLAARDAEERKVVKENE